MYRMTRVYTLPDGSNVPFYTHQEKHCSKFTTKYVDDRLFAERFLSEDGRTFTITHIWVSKEAYDRYRADPETRAEQERARAYNEKNGITVTVTTEELD